MINATDEQRILLEQLRTRDDSLELYWDEVRGVAVSLRGRLDLGPSLNAEDQVAAFLRDFGILFGPPGLPGGLELLQSDRDELEWQHLVYAYLVDGEYELYGAKLVAHVDPEGVLADLESSLWREVPVDLDARITLHQVGDILRRRIEGQEGFAALRNRLADEPHFPATDPPRLVVFPWGESFRLAWATYGYTDPDETYGDPEQPLAIDYGRIFLDAITGERLVFAPTWMIAETKTTGSGSAVTPVTGKKTTRTLNIVRVGTGNTYRLKDLTRGRTIITHDIACDTDYDHKDEIAKAIKDGTLPVSEDTDGDHNWNRLPKDSTNAERTAGQPPEVDGHYLVGQIYDWYKALGREGWDNGKFKNPPVPPQTLHVLTHAFVNGQCYTANAQSVVYKYDGTVYSWLTFAEGDSDWDYQSGSPWTVGHEYQHTVTNFSFQDASGDPGLLYKGWLGAVHEALSDAFGSLSTEVWQPDREISLSTPPKIFRNVAYPRDTQAAAPNKLDHFDDRNTHPAGTSDWSKFYRRGTILAHCAYLMGKGGVHQRAVRTPQLIPVCSLGRETVGGKSVLKAGRIWLRALEKHAATLGSLTGLQDTDESAFRTLRNACVKSAEELYGKKAEYHNTILAFYAVGLHPVDVTYGADVTFLRWGIDWDLSRKYVGLTSPDYSSLDLFINNGGTSEWNAQINITDPNTGKPTEYENDVYCRVRNVGDQEAKNVKVEFHYAKAGTATWNWLPVVDKNGTAQVLLVGNLAAGASTFADSAQNKPPPTARVRWCIPPLAAGEKVHHYCLRARVTCDNDANPFNNEVQSNVTFTPYSPPETPKTCFVAGNPYPEDDLDMDVRMNPRLPSEWRVDLRGLIQGERLHGREERVLELAIRTPPGADQTLEEPLDGDVTGRMSGDYPGAFTGSLDETMLRGNRLIGRFAAHVDASGPVSGFFDGTVDLSTGEIQGRVTGPDPHDVLRECNVRIRGCLRPWRRVEVSQWDGQTLIGGITVQVQVPWRTSPCALALPPTGTTVTPPRRILPILVASERLLRRFGLDGELLAEWFVDPGIRSVALTSGGEVIVATLDAPLIQVYSPDGDLLDQWEAPVPPSGVAVGPEGELLITAAAENLVFLCAPGGQILAEWPTPGAPTGIAVSPERHVYLACEDGHLVAVLGPDGERLAEWQVDFGVIETNGIVVDPQGTIWVASREGVVARYSPEGDLLIHWPVDGLPTGLSAGPEGEVAVVLEEHRVQVYSPDGELLHEWVV